MTKHVFLMTDAGDEQQNLERFQANACEKPFFTLTSWPVDDAIVSKQRILAINHRKVLHELQRVGKKGNRSWFVGNQVVKDGRTILMTPMDPLYVLLSKLSASSNKSKCLGDLLSSHRWWFDLSEIDENSIESICHIDRSYLSANYLLYDLHVKANKDKIRLWLSRKVERLVDVIAISEQNEALGYHPDASLDCTHKDTHSNVTTFDRQIPSRNTEHKQDIRYTREAVQILEEYLNAEWFTELCSNYSLDIKSFDSVDKSCTDSDPSLELSRFDFRKRNASSEEKRSELGNRQQNRKKLKLDATQSRRMKSIKSFFH